MPNDARKLVAEPAYRIRVGEYRIVHAFDVELIDVIRIEHRSDAYRKR